MDWCPTFFNYVSIHRRHTGHTDCNIFQLQEILGNRGDTAISRFSRRRGHCDLHDAFNGRDALRENRFDVSAVSPRRRLGTVSGQVACQYANRDESIDDIPYLDCFIISVQFGFV